MIDEPRRPQRKFELGQMVWLRLGDSELFARVWGYEWGGDLRTVNYVPCWVYYARSAGHDGLVEYHVAKEDQLRELEGASDCLKGD